MWSQKNQFQVNVVTEKSISGKKKEFFPGYLVDLGQLLMSSLIWESQPETHILFCLAL
jgi:hypothetical protein